MGVGLFPHIPLPEFAVEVVAVGPVGFLEVLAHRDDRRTRHGSIIPLFGPVVRNNIWPFAGSVSVTSPLIPNRPPRIQ